MTALSRDQIFKIHMAVAEQCNAEVQDHEAQLKFIQKRQNAAIQRANRLKAIKNER